MACHTQDEIAKECDCPQQTVADILPKTAELPKSVKPAADHLTDFEVPIFNVWKNQKKSKGSSRPGNPLCFRPFRRKLPIQADS